VTGGRAPSFHDLSMGETAAPSLSRGMRRGQNSPVDKSSEKTSPGTPEREKSFPVPGKALALPIGGAGVCVGLQLYPLPYALSLGPYATMVFHRSFYRAQACSKSPHRRSIAIKL
jgi:hypothetical protein